MKRFLFQAVVQLLLMATFTSVPFAGYALMVGSFESRSNAERYAANTVENLSPFASNAFVEQVQIPDKGLWYRVCVGPFESRKQALKRKQALQTNKNDIEMILVRTDARAIDVKELTEIDESVPKRATSQKAKRNKNPLSAPANKRTSTNQYRSAHLLHSLERS